MSFRKSMSKLKIEESKQSHSQWLQLNHALVTLRTRPGEPKEDVGKLTQNMLGTFTGNKLTTFAKISHPK